MKKMKQLTKYECDTAMADKKGYLPCNRNCGACHAAIRTYDDGSRAHLTQVKRTKNWEWD